MVMFMGMQVMAQQKEAYAFLSTDGTTLTFYYDDQMNNREGGTAYALNTGYDYPGWYKKSDDGIEYPNEITTVEFTSFFKYARPTSTYCWFYNQVNLTTITGLNNLNTSEVTNMSYMFDGCYCLKSLDLRTFNTSKVTRMMGMFRMCYSLENLDLSSFDTRNVTDMSDMFNECNYLKSLDLTSFNTSKVTDMSYMFYNDFSIKTIHVGDGWNIEKLRSTPTEYSENGWYRMFEDCYSLIGEKGTECHGITRKEYARIDGGTSTPGYLSGPLTIAYAVLSSDGKTLTFYYDTKKAIRQGGTAYLLNTGDYVQGWYIAYDFNEENPNKITTVEFTSSFKDARPTSTYYWFGDQNNLTTITGISNLNTSNVTNMRSMFYHCSSLTSLDVSNFNTSEVTDMSFMFYGCSSLTSLDLSSFNTSKVTNMVWMFSNDKELTTIYVGDRWTTSNMTSIAGDYMFSGCTSLKGENGTEFDSNHTDKEYARFDGPYYPGYFSSLTYDLIIAGTPVTSRNKSNILNKGVFSYSPANKTLTVKGEYYNTDDKDIIKSDIDGLIIDVAQDATLTEKTNSMGCPIWLNANATIKGNGKLTLNGSQNNAGLYLYNGASVTIDHMEMSIQGMWGISGPWRHNGEKLIVKSSDLSINTPTDADKSAAICDLSGGMVLLGCMIANPSGASFEDSGVSYNGELVKSVTMSYTGEVGITTDISEALPQDKVQSSKFKVQSEEWYTIDGRKLSGKPTKKGVYIHNGKKVMR